MPLILSLATHEAKLRLPLLLLFGLLVTPPADAQILDKLKEGARRGAERAAEREAARRADRAVTAAFDIAEDDPTAVVDGFGWFQVDPAAVATGPFRTTTTVPFELTAAGTARLVVYDVLGREVARLADGHRVASYPRPSSTRPAGPAASTSYGSTPTAARRPARRYSSANASSPRSAHVSHTQPHLTHASPTPAPRPLRALRLPPARLRLRRRGEGDGDDGGGRATIEATVDGSAFAATLIATADRNDDSSVDVVGSDQNCTASNNDTVASMIITSTGESFATVLGDSGTITVTSISDDRIMETFAFTATSTLSNTVDVTNGTFDVAFLEN